ncbi:phosphoadenosine phosphosulfate reductase, partial [Candidatus Pacearchaeota archaeon]|nr:phosphoadenosine phosphosulfate reductase [Candidatus Pacearchaeota archaeon]
MRTFSFGAGVQSTAVLVLQAMGRLPEPYDVFLFANVGDDSEHPASLDYFRDVHIPYAEAHGIDLQEVKRVKRDGTSPTLLEDALAQERSIPLPLYLEGG